MRCPAELLAAALGRLAGLACLRIPHERLVSIDARMREVVARAVIVPDAVVIDRGRVFVVEVFVRAWVSPSSRRGRDVEPIWTLDEPQDLLGPTPRSNVNAHGSKPSRRDLINRRASRTFDVDGQTDVHLVRFETR